jgi:radical SAM family uncharacterized protein
LSYPNNILAKVTKPARYTGGEWNSILKSWDETPIKVALSYPDIYEIAMPNMALPILYKMLNNYPDVLAERVFAPWTDMEEALRSNGIPLLSLESQRPLNSFDLVGFSLGYELTYTNILNILDLGGVPVLAAERGKDDPLVIGGGSGAFNPEPLADFIDAFVLGDGEAVLPELIDCYRRFKSNGGSRAKLLSELSKLRGVYVPSLYGVEYGADGLVGKVIPLGGNGALVERVMVEQLPPPVTAPIVPYIETVQDRGAVEISRGCSRGCRFCHAGMICRPVRRRSPQEIIEAIGSIRANCGYDEFSLLSLNTSDYPDIEGLIGKIDERFSEERLAVTLPSLRISPSSVKLVAALRGKRRGGLTFAPETASPRLQKVINKAVAEEELMATAEAAFRGGWTTLKLYYMLGLPTEQMADIEEIARQISDVYALGRLASGRRPQLRINLATFVPKAHTPFQWVGQESEQSLKEKHDFLRNSLKQRGIHLSWENTDISRLEAVLSRGDRRIGQVIYRAWQLGATFDAWREHFNYDKWLKAFYETGIDPVFYANRERSLEETLPWAHLSSGADSAFFKREYQHALKDETTDDCRTASCNVCGLEKQHPDCATKLSGS